MPVEGNGILSLESTCPGEVYDDGSGAHHGSYVVSIVVICYLFGE